MGGPHALRCKAFRAGLNLRRKEVFFAEVFKASHQRTLSAFWGSSARQSSREHLPFLSLRPANHASPRWTLQRTCQGLAVNLNTCLSLLPFLALNFTCYVKIGESPRVYRIHTGESQSRILRHSFRVFLRLPRDQRETNRFGGLTHICKNAFVFTRILSVRSEPRAEASHARGGHRAREWLAAGPLRPSHPWQEAQQWL